jgi:hypothetical protein
MFHSFDELDSRNIDSSKLQSWHPSVGTFLTGKTEMNRLMTRSLAAMTVVTAAVLFTETADAGHDPPVYCAAERYREAVREFERHVLDVRYIARCDERLVDDLEDSTARLRSAARHCDRPDRLFERFCETERLHRRVEWVFFSSGKYARNIELERCWRHVHHSYGTLVEEIRRLGVGHPHGHRPPHFSHHGTHDGNGRGSRFHPDPFYRSEFTPTFRPETFGPRPALSSRSKLSPHAAASQRPTSHYRSARPNLSPVSPLGVQLQRNPRSIVPARKTIQSPTDLRAAIVGALLQRAFD